MKVFATFAASLVVAAAACDPSAFAQVGSGNVGKQNQPVQTQQMAMPQQFAQMQQMMQRAQSAKSAEQRREFMQQHMAAMTSTMQTMMGGMGRGFGTPSGMGPRGGMMEGGAGRGMMQGTPAAEGGAVATLTRHETVQARMQQMMQMMDQMLQQQQMMLNAAPAKADDKH